MAQIWEPDWSETHGCWTVDFRVKGRRVRRRLEIRDRGDKALARREARHLYDAAWDAHFNQPERPAGTPFWKAAKAYVDAGGEARFLPPLIRYFGKETTCETIGPVEIAGAALDLYPGRARSTIRRQVEVPVDAVLNFARGKRRRSTGDVVRTRWLTPEEAERLLGVADPRTRRMIGFLLSTGCRTGEMLAAETADLDLEGATFWVRGEKPGAGKSRAAERLVNLPPRGVKLLKNLANDADAAGPLFLTPKGDAYVLRNRGGGQIQAAFNKARDLAGLGRDVTPHVCRHTWATWHYACQLDLIRLMVEGGWAKPDMAMRYTKLAPPDLPVRLRAFGWDFGKDLGNGRDRRYEMPSFQVVARR